MPKISHSLVKTLDAIRPYDGDADFMSALVSEKSPIDGYSPKRLVHDIGELQEAGMLKVFIYNGVPDSFDLTAAGRDYHRNRAVEVASAIGGVALQMLVGASGGLVVFALGKVLGS